MLVHGGPLVYPEDTFGCWRAVAQSALWPDCVIVASPSFDQDLGLAQRVEDLPVQQFVAEAGVEALAVAVFLW
jgi:hypothetical protein